MKVSECDIIVDELLECLVKLNIEVVLFGIVVVFMLVGIFIYNDKEY